MHFSFIAYGSRREVELLLRDMESQKHKLIMRKGKEEKYIWAQGQVRLLPGGIYEYLFPKESKDIVLSTLREGDEDAYDLKLWPFAIIRRMLRLKKIPKFNTENKYLWLKDNVSIIPIGIREDGELTEPSGVYKGWTHEAL